LIQEYLPIINTDARNQGDGFSQVSALTSIAKINETGRNGASTSQWRYVF
jgi:hypothetical protein